jgi:hypothetical protein
MTSGRIEDINVRWHRRPFTRDMITMQIVHSDLPLSMRASGRRTDCFEQYAIRRHVQRPWCVADLGI